MFKISDAVSQKAWGDVDKTEIKNLLVKGLENDDGNGTVKKAIREVYAVIKDSDITQAPSENWWGPHHEVGSDGTIRVNKGGVTACAAALAGSRAEPSLTGAQKKSGATHILKHYRELELTPPASLLQLAGELDTTLAINLIAEINGEIAVSDIPIAPGVDLEKLKEGDSEPLEVAVEINSGLSTRKWNYTPETIKKIVDQINERTPNGFLGHQKPEDIDSEFPDVATHWIGALFRDGKAFVRGYVDPSMAKLKRLIKSNRVRQVSIFGIPTLTQSGGETKVTDYQLLSLDWTPLDRNGMPTRIVATSEMATLDLFNEFDSIAAQNSSKSGTPGGETMTKEEIIAAVKLMLAKGEMKSEEVKALVGDAEEAVKVKDIAAKLKVEPDKLEGELGRLMGVEQDVKKEKHSKLVEKVLKEKIADETIRGLVGEILQTGMEDDEIKITAEIAKVLEKDVVKKAMSELHIDKPAAAGVAGKDRQFTQFEKAKIS